MIKSQEFQKQLEIASSLVGSWPEWKQKILELVPDQLSPCLGLLWTKAGIRGEREDIEAKLDE